MRMALSALLQSLLPAGCDGQPPCDEVDDLSWHLTPRTDMHLVDGPHNPGDELDGLDSGPVVNADQ